MVYFHLRSKQEFLNCTLWSLWYWYFSTWALWSLCLPSLDILVCCLFFLLLLRFFWFFWVFSWRKQCIPVGSNTFHCAELCVHMAQGAVTIRANDALNPRSSRGSCHTQGAAESPERASGHPSGFLITHVGSPRCSASARPAWNGFFTPLGKKLGLSQKQGSSALCRAARGVAIPSLVEMAGRGLRDGAGEGPCARCDPRGSPQSGCGHLPAFRLPDFPGMEVLPTCLFSHSHSTSLLSKHPLLLSPLWLQSPWVPPWMHRVPVKCHVQMCTVWHLPSLPVSEADTEHDRV